MMQSKRLGSCVCTQRQLESETFQNWLPLLGESRGRMHRKAWEWVFIAQALEERGMLQPGRRGLGFAVGTEPLPALFANRGCDVLATDLPASDSASAPWAATAQHAAGLAALNGRGLCPPEKFAERVRFRAVNMRRLPADLGEFDFIWSSCSFEHLGSLGRGMRFMVDMTRHLRPGGVAVHTTEYNVSSQVKTIERGPSVIYRQKDLVALSANLAKIGCRTEPFDFTSGDLPGDLYVDQPPYESPVHLKLNLDGFVATSIGIIVNGGPKVGWLRRAWVSALTRAA